MKRKEQKFELVIDFPPDEETIRDFHRAIAQVLVNKYGTETMKKVLEEFKKQ